MRKAILLFIIILTNTSAYAACTSEGTSYYACKPGYYLSGGNCIACPDGGTSADRNNTGIGACYLPAGTTGSDTTGKYSHTADCYY